MAHRRRSVAFRPSLESCESRLVLSRVAVAVDSPLIFEGTYSLPGQPPVRAEEYAHSRFVPSSGAIAANFDSFRQFSSLRGRLGGGFLDCSITFQDGNLIRATGPALVRSQAGSPTELRAECVLRDSAGRLIGFLSVRPWGSPGALTPEVDPIG